MFVWRYTFPRFLYAISSERSRVLAESDIYGTYIRLFALLSRHALAVGAYLFYSTVLSYALIYCVILDRAFVLLSCSRLHSCYEFVSIKILELVNSGKIWGHKCGRPFRQWKSRYPYQKGLGHARTHPLLNHFSPTPSKQQLR